MEEEVQLGAGMIEFGEPWSVRISAAINNAEELWNKRGRHALQGALTDGTSIVITAGELALAKEFYEFSAATQVLVNAVEEEPPDVIWPAALCRFTEKVEKLT